MPADTHDNVIVDSRGGAAPEAALAQQEASDGSDPEHSLPG